MKCTPRKPDIRGCRFFLQLLISEYNIHICMYRSFIVNNIPLTHPSRFVHFPSQKNHKIVLNFEAVRALYEESLAEAKEVGEKLDIVHDLEGLAGLAAAQGEPARAAQLWGAAEALRESIGAAVPPIDRAAYERTVPAARTELGQEAFAKAWAEGRAMSLEPLIAEVLKMES